MESYSSHTCFSFISYLCPFPGVVLRRRSFFRRGERETRPTRASVSSCWIGNQAMRLTCEKPLAVATSLIDPFCPGGRGAVSSGRSLFRYLNRPQANTSALPLLTPVYSPEGQVPQRTMHKLLYEPTSDVRGQGRHLEQDPHVT